MPMPEQLPHVPVLPTRYTDPRETVFHQQPQQQFSILTIGLVLTHALGTNLACVSDPKLESELIHQPLEPAPVPAGFHPDADLDSSLVEFTVELLGLAGMFKPTFTAFSCFAIDKGDLLEARVVITTYNLHVRLLSPEPLVGSGEPQSLLGRWEPSAYGRPFDPHCQPALLASPYHRPWAPRPTSADGSKKPAANST